MLLLLLRVSILDDYPEILHIGLNIAPTERVVRVCSLLATTEEARVIVTIFLMHRRSPVNRRLRTSIPRVEKNVITIYIAKIHQRKKPS